MNVLNNPDPLFARDFFAEIFGEAPDLERIRRATCIALTEGGSDSLVAVGCLEEGPCAGMGYVWLFAVAENYRGRGLGALLLDEIVSHARKTGLSVIELKTYQKWYSMRDMLLKHGWVLVRAEPSKREDGVGEIWQLPLLSRPLRVAVIGCNPEGRGGEWAKTILDLPEWWNLAAVVDPSPEVRQFWASQGLQVFESLDDIPALLEIGAAVVAVPPRFALQIQKQAIDRGWAMLVEKPLAASMGEIIELQDMLRGGRARLVAGVQRRSHPSYVALKALLADCEIRNLTVRISLGRPEDSGLAGHRGDPSQCRGGALLDMGYHALDLAHFLIGKPVELVSCSLRNREDLAADADSAADLLCRSGTAWLRILVDRHSIKTEQVAVQTADGVFIADRSGVASQEHGTLYTCPPAWHSAEKARLSALVAACLCPASAEGNLWEHLALFETVERAYGIASQLGAVGGAQS